ncbi:hypothetical protein GOP47_0015964 [Adiantum capillus-veneris]|uniref:Pentatricopeptide repeat-containing protein n=1 Tax=Adiantum capillus-veneris TaxID=13818 RepID=A0A9D4ULT4_ADICA|nr:hypothetical protein GOP47_0015964 [Adiantum capillus-veneris]
MWTLLMSACNQCKRSETTLKLYLLMQEDGIEPDNHAYVCLLKACSTLNNLQEGKKLHAKVRAKGVVLDVYVNNILVNMYGKCGDIGEAENVFGAMHERNLTSWTSMISAYAAVGHGEKALQLYRFMQEACYVLLDKRKKNGNPTELLCLNIGQALHADARKNRFMTNTYVSTALVRMYGKERRIYCY